jgi:hypothetical protein
MIFTIECWFGIIHTPQSAVTNERYDYTLLDISDAEIETQTEINTEK